MPTPEHRQELHSKAETTALYVSDTINFAWTDNVHDEGDYSKFSGDILDFYTSGDVAPGGRFKYSFISTAENSGECCPATC